MNYCSHCGHSVELRVPEGDNLPRYVCPSCDTIHYQNPNNVTGCILQWQGKILLCRRAIEPHYGLWTLPAGFMENGESTAEGAAREAYEEAMAVAKDLQLYTLYSLPHISQVYMLFRGELENGYSAPGTESLETTLFSEADLPWDQLAFPVVRETLKRYFADLKQGQFSVHCGDIIREQNQLKVIHYPSV